MIKLAIEMSFERTFLRREEESSEGQKSVVRRVDTISRFLEASVCFSFLSLSHLLVSNPLWFEPP